MKNRFLVEKYLKYYSDPLAHLPFTFKAPYSKALVIPMRSEDDFFLESCIPSLKRAAGLEKKVLLILVVNARTNDPVGILSKNTEVLLKLNASPAEPFSFSALSPSLDLFIINCSTQARFLGEREGVGRARKIGADLFLDLYARGGIEEPWIFSSDADVLFPEDYFHFSHLLNSGSHVLGNYSFAHFSLPNEGLEECQAVQDYDFYLRYYVAGLDFSKSPYAHPTIGSTQVIHAEAYAAVRGYPNLMAGEDFYIANKLMKVGSALSPSHLTPLKLSGRKSSRVPFGTGSSVIKISENYRHQKTFDVYDPKIFIELRNFLLCLNESSGHKNWNKFETHWNELTRYPQAVVKLIEIWKLEPLLMQLWRMSPDPEKTRVHLHNWFDAFRTLKFVHAFRDEALPNVEVHKLKRSSHEPAKIFSFS